jgi:hypothetical protein
VSKQATSILFSPPPGANIPRLCKSFCIIPLVSRQPFNIGNYHTYTLAHVPVGDNGAPPRWMDNVAFGEKEHGVLVSGSEMDEYHRYLALPL